MNRVSTVASMRKDRKRFPQVMEDLENRDEKSTKFCYFDDKKKLLTSHVNKKTFPKKRVIIFSTMHKVVRMTCDKKNPI